MCVLVQFLSSEKGVRLGLVVEGEGRAPGTRVLEICLRLQYRGFELDMQETSATEVSESPSSPCKLESLSGQRDPKSARVWS